VGGGARARARGRVREPGGDAGGPARPLDDPHLVHGHPHPRAPRPRARGVPEGRPGAGPDPLSGGPRPAAPAARAGEPRLTRRAFLAGAGAALATGCGSGPSPERLPAELLAFHRDCFVFDLHIDTLLWQRLLGYDLFARHEPLLPRAAFAWQFDLPRAADGGLDGAVFGLVISPRETRPEQPPELRWLARLERGAGLDQTLATLDLLRRDADAQPQRLRFCTRGSELRAAAAEGCFAGLAGLEGAHGIEADLANVRAAFEAGLRMLGLVHFQASAAAYPMTVPGFDDRGLTPFGFDLVAELEALGIVADLAHLNARGLDDALAALTRPFVVSHSGCRAVVDHPRNLSDDALRRIAAGGGVVGIAAGEDFLGPGGLDAFAAHAEQLVRVAGEDTPALGSDWDGAIVPVPGLEDVRGLPFLTSRLLERGWSEVAVRKLLGENALRVLTDVLG
jgi:membrane dipeptidase